MRQIEFLDELSDGTYVCVISSDNQHYLAIEKLLANGDTFKDRASGNYQNSKMLSEALRDAIGYGSARDLLIKNGIAENDPLMYLGRNT